MKGAHLAELLDHIAVIKRRVALIEELMYAPPSENCSVGFFKEEFSHEE